MEKTAHKSTSFPSLNTLFADSWEMFKGSMLNLLIITIISIVIYVVIFIVGLLLALPLGAYSIFSAIQSQQLTPAFFSSLGGLGIIVGIAMIASVIVSFAIQAASILVVANYKHKPNAGQMVKKGFSFVVPLFLASVVTGFIISGGYFLFIIPGILFQVALYFVTYEIVLNNKGVLAACRRSMGIVFANFWSVFGRFLLLTAIILGISFVPSMIVGASESDALSTIWSFVSSILSVLISWWSISYAITLYRQAEKAAPATKTGKLLWPTLTALVGWIIGVIMIASVLWFVFSVLIPQIQNAALQRDAQENMQSGENSGEGFNPQMILDAQQDGSTLMDDGTMMKNESMMMYQEPTN